MDNSFEILVSRFMPLLGTCRKDRRLSGCQGGADRNPTPANDVVTLENEQVVYMPDDNHRNPSREAKHQ